MITLVGRVVPNSPFVFGKGSGDLCASVLTSVMILDLIDHALGFRVAMQLSYQLGTWIGAED